MMAHPVVYGSAGSNHVWSARLALAEKGVTHELVDVPFGAHREQPHLSRQPFAKVPGFEHDGFALYETQAIMRYVDERFPGTPLQPEDVHAWSRMPPPCTSAAVGPPRPSLRRRDGGAVIRPLAKRSTSRTATRGLTKCETSPPRAPISVTKRDEVNWKTVRGLNW
jgi:glutathione S-transferase-like protein